jgi:CheY-like chemotaxis protein
LTTANPVLLVEDDALVSLATEQILLDAGFAVEVAGNGSEAIRLLEDKSKSFCALVTDVRMPGFSGWDVARRARELFPALPVIYATGDSAADWRAQGVPESVMLQKPYADAQLITALSTLLNAAQMSAGIPTNQGL